MWIVLCAIGGCAYFLCPAPLQFLLTGINFFVPDPIPFLDEVIMIGGILAKLFWIDNFYISDYVEDLKDFFFHKKGRRLLFRIILIIAIIFLIYKYVMPKG